MRGPYVHRWRPRSFRCAGECAKSPETTGSKFKSDSCRAVKPDPLHLQLLCFIIPFKKYFKSTRKDKSKTRGPALLTEGRLVEQLTAVRGGVRRVGGRR